MPFLPDVHIDQALSNVSQAFSQEPNAFIGDKILPVAPVDKRSDDWFVYGREAFFKRDDLRRPGAHAMELTYSVSKSFYNAEEHSQRHLVTDSERRLSDTPLKPDVDATEILTASVQLQREVAQLALVTSTSNITQNSTLAGNTQWSDYTNSVPLTNIRTARTTVRQGVLREANTISMGYEVALVLADHPSVKDLLKYTHPDAINMAGLPSTIRGLQVLVGMGGTNSANEGQTQTAFSTSLFGKNALVHFTNPTIGLKMQTLGLTLEAPDDTTGARGFSVRKYRDEDKKGDWVEVSNTYTAQLLQALAGYLFAAAVA